MNRVATSRPICRYFKPQVVVQSAISTVTAEEVKTLIGDVSVVDIQLRIDDSPMRRLTASPFHAGTENLYINGLRCTTDDYTLLTDESGNGIGVVCTELEADDDVRLTADIVE